VVKIHIGSFYIVTLCI